MPRRRRTFSVAEELNVKSREAALSAVQIFNNPLIHFKSESFIVLMIIAWTYLLHAYYRKNGIEYRYYRQGNKRRSFDRTKSGAYKYWELERCLNDDKCPLDRNTSNNLRFLIGLRHEIEHQMTMRLDDYLSGRYQACAMNFNRYIKSLFGDKCGIDKYLTFSIQLAELSLDQISQATEGDVPPRLRSYILDFDSRLTEEEYNHEAYSYRVHFSKKLVNRPGQADRVIEFIDPNSELADGIEKEYWVKKEVERPKYLPKQICQMMQNEGFANFTIHRHTRLWQSLDAKNPSRGYGVQLANGWQWYESWIDIVRKHCREHVEIYGDNSASK